jgi:hypothetical protein
MEHDFATGRKLELDTAVPFTRVCVGQSSIKLHPTWTLLACDTRNYS